MMKHTLVMDLTDTFDFSSNRSEDAKEFHQIQAAAVKSLERIQSIYEQIMAPSDIYSTTPSFELEELRIPPDSPVLAHEDQNRRVPPKSAMNELCTNCRNVVSRCNYCKFCICSDSSSDLPSNSEHGLESRWRRHRRKNSSETLKVTVPRPFALSHMDASRRMATEAKMQKLKEELKIETEKEMRVRIRSRPVPKHTRLPLYEKMVEDGEKRKARRKEIGLEVSRNSIPQNTRVTDSVAVKKLKTFKAKPVPEHILSDKVSERLRNKEEIRKMLIAQRAEEILMSARSPFSERLRKTRSEVDLTNVVRKNDHKMTKKNISAITDRLYVKKCRETMDDWNRKVLDFDQREESGKRSSSTLPLSALPFSFFPIRMSNAAMSREKQIR